MIRTYPKNGHWHARVRDVNGKLHEFPLAAKNHHEAHLEAIELQERITTPVVRVGRTKEVS